MSKLRDIVITDDITGTAAEVNDDKQLEVRSVLGDNNGLDLELTADNNVPTETIKTFFTQNPDGTERQVTTQNPFPVSDGFVCSNDLWVAKSNMYNFSGVPTDLFDNLHSVITDSTANNPKELLIHMNNPVITNVIALGAFAGAAGQFSNVEIQVARSDGVFITIIDESTDSTIVRTADYLIPVTFGFNAIKLRFHTVNTITLSNLVVPTVKSTVSRLQAVSEASGAVEDIHSFSGALNVTDGLVHKLFVNRFFEQDGVASTTLAIAATALDRVINVVSAAAFSPGDIIEIRTNGAGSVLEIDFIIISIAVNAITLNREVDNDYLAGANVIQVSPNMAVDGSAVPQSFKIVPPSSGGRSIFQITRMLITMRHAGVPDDDRFGGIGALTNGVIVRAFFDGGYRTATQWFNNSDMVADMFNVDYRPKAPAGNYGTACRWTITESGAIFEMDGIDLEYLEIIIQDDLTGLASFRMKGQGRVFGE